MAEPKKTRARYRRVRDDVFGHPKSGGMRLQAYGLMFYATSQNLLGVMQQSARAISARFGNSAGEVREVIKLLTTPRNGCAPIAMWWPEIETLWIIEALDEQSDGESVDRAAAKLVATLPAQVRAAIIERYGDRVSGTLPGERVGGGWGEGVSPQETGAGNRRQEQDSGSTPTPPREGSSSGISVETRAEAEHIGASFTLTEPKPGKPRKARLDYPDEFELAFVDAFNAACKASSPPRRGLRRPLSATYHDALRKLWAAEQPTADDVRHVIAVRAAMDAAGEGYGALELVHLCRAEQFCRYREKPIPTTTGTAKAWTPSVFKPNEHRTIGPCSCPACKPNGEIET